MNNEEAEYQFRSSQTNCMAMGIRHEHGRNVLSGTPLVSFAVEAYVQQAFNCPHAFDYRINLLPPDGKAERSDRRDQLPVP